MRLAVLSAFMLIIPGIAHAQDGWQTAVVCSATPASSADGTKLTIVAASRVAEDGKTRSSMNVRLQSNSAIVAPDVNVKDVSFTVDQQSPISGLNAKGGAKNSVLIDATTASGLVSALSSGNSLTVTIPQEAGPKTFTFPLTGSGVALKRLAPCIG